jgi:hypothetical protein
MVDMGISIAHGLKSAGDYFNLVFGHMRILIRTQALFVSMRHGFLQLHGLKRLAGYRATGLLLCSTRDREPYLWCAG